uniref:Acetyl-coenzyme A carboxylase carboxyl transferase subunit beta n=1 Tax=Schwalbea americana TaxID=86091 RepID=V6BQI4_9LAMI|nr:acetyl-CoA carboxylase beta subunit [Schwalbea americana]CDJ38632.1 acetyl-CoA carboxylase beta subunit [Schwalbea americana]
MNGHKFRKVNFYKKFEQKNGRKKYLVLDKGIGNVVPDDSTEGESVISTYRNLIDTELTDNLSIFFSCIGSSLNDRSISGYLFDQLKNSSESGGSSIRPHEGSSGLPLINSSNLEGTAKYRHLWVQCENEDCYGLNYKKFFLEKLNICEHCGDHLAMSSSERIQVLLDPGTWYPMDEDMIVLDGIELNAKKQTLPETETQEEEESGDYIEEKKTGKDKEKPCRHHIPSYPRRCPNGIPYGPNGIPYRPFEEPDLDPFEEPDLDLPFYPRRCSHRIPYRPFEEPDHIPSYPRRCPHRIPYRPNGPVKEPDLDLPDQTTTDEAQEENLALGLRTTGEEFYRRVAIENRIAEVMDALDALQKKVSEDLELHYAEDKDDEPYSDRIDSYQRNTGLTEAVQTGVGQLNGIRIAIGIMDFEFIGGSMGCTVGEKITRLIEYATNHFLPLILVCASGGARMQEGSLSLLQMAKISSALYNYQLNTKLLYVSILTSPTTGGVTASFGMLGDIIIAEPNAYIAFAGKRVIEETLNIEVPEGIQETENLFEKGSFDLIVPRTLLKSVLSELFKLHGFLPLNSN